MVNTEIRLILFFATKDGEALYSQHKQDCTWRQKLSLRLLWTYEYGKHRSFRNRFDKSENFGLNSLPTECIVEP